MNWASLLDPIIYGFRPVFGSQNFAHFVTYIWGLIFCDGRHRVTDLYLAGEGQSSYWALLKFLGRGQWDLQKLAASLLHTLLGYLPELIYVYDHSHAIKTGKAQYGLHFFRNHRYRLRNTNQSKFHCGHQFAGLGLLALCGGASYLFPVWVRLIQPGAQSALLAFEQVLEILPAGLLIFDRGFNNRKYFKRLLAKGHHLLCRARSNMVFYYLPTQAQQKKRGRKRLYGKRVDFRRWRYETLFIPALGQSVEVASRLVRSKCCPQPIRLVVRRTKPKKGKPYRYFLVYTTDLTLSVERIITLYKRRWTFETAMHDAKESFGFDHYQVRSKRAIERHVQLSFLAASLIQLLTLPTFLEQKKQLQPDLKTALKKMNIHWYHPKRWTLGLTLKYLKWTDRHLAFSPTIDLNPTKRKWQDPYYDQAAA